MAEIQLLLQDKGNRRALASLVGEHYTPITDTAVQSVDLYVVDDISFPQYQEALATEKERFAPVFCPVVLIRRSQTPVTIDLPDPVTSEGPLIVNEVLTAPVEKQALFRSITNLLARRRQTEDLAGELQERNERLEQFASKLSHELRNSLNLLDGYLDIALESGDPDAFDECQQAIGRMTRMVNDTLHLAREGGLAPEPEAVCMQDILESCWRAVPTPQATIEIDIEEDIYADKKYLRRVLMNLLRNGAEHGGRDVTITVGALEDGFFVEDDGPGIPRSKRDHVFEEGYTTAAQGTGLGLSVVKDLVAAHGWNIRVSEGNSGGARFEISGVEIVG